MKKIVSFFIAVVVIGIVGITVFADEVGVETKGIQAIGLTFMNIDVTTSGSTAYIDIDESCSNTATQLGSRSSTVQVYNGSSWVKYVSLSQSYGTNTTYHLASYSFTMQSGVQYRVVTEHYCIISGTTYKQSQTSVTFSR